MPVLIGGLAGGLDSMVEFGEVDAEGLQGAGLALAVVYRLPLDVGGIAFRFLAVTVEEPTVVANLLPEYSTANPWIIWAVLCRLTVIVDRLANADDLSAESCRTRH